MILGLVLGTVLVFFLGIVAGLGIAVRVLRMADPSLDAQVELLVERKRREGR